MKKRIYFFLIVVLVLVTAGVAVLVGSNTESKPVVCIDAGHGGNDVGAELSGRYEKDDNLTLSLKVKKELEAKNIKVVMTRNEDESVSLDDRCKLANRKGASLFVSLHRNSADSGNGVEIWIKSDAPEEDKLLAENILSKLETVGVSKNRGVKTGLQSNPQGNYYVNKYTDMPSCLVEMGFITNENDNELFDKKTDEYAKAIADAAYDTLQSLQNQ